MASIMADKPIFFDATGRRAARISALVWALTILGLVVFVGVAANVVLSPPVNSPDLPGRTVGVNPAYLARRAQKPGLLARAERLAAAARVRRVEISRLRRAQATAPSRVLSAILKPQDGRALAVGFYVNWQAGAGGQLHRAQAGAAAAGLGGADLDDPGRPQAGSQDHPRP